MGILAEKQKARLFHWLATSEDARRFYVRATGLSASLYSNASEMQTEAPDNVAPMRDTLPLWRWVLGSLTAAASIALVVWAGRPKHEAAAVEPPRMEFVAQLTGSKGCQWLDGATAVQPGGRLRKGERIELTGGFAEITFDSGAQVVLAGPGSLDVKSAWEAVLNRGALKASVPPEAVGFSVSNPNVEVVDLGTEFTMSADASGTAEVLVLKGEVEAQSNTAAERQPILLKAKESRRFATSGVSDISDGGQRLARFTQPVTLDHFPPPTHCLHWSFDETNGTTFSCDNYGREAGPSRMQLKSTSESPLAALHVEGHRGSGLRFDGHVYGRAALPGISGSSPHTVLFWVRLPKDAKLSNAYAMVAWSANGEASGSHPTHIGWNRNPAEGTVGVLRTDYGGGYAMGATPLRDGQWHHIAVVFIPGEGAHQPIGVKQYVDGRLEGEGESSPPGSDIFSRKSSGERSSAISDTLWLGSRLGISNVRAERFVGQMDELFVADRALEPEEIVQLMNDNHLTIEMAATGPTQ